MYVHWKRRKRQIRRCGASGGVVEIKKYSSNFLGSFKNVAKAEKANIN